LAAHDLSGQEPTARTLRRRRRFADDEHAHEPVVQARRAHRARRDGRQNGGFAEGRAVTLFGVAYVPTIE
jgi:hypothetical protein